MKICSKCKESKSFDNFSKRIDSKDGYRSQCKNCVRLNPNTKKISKNYYLKNRENLLKKSNERKRNQLDPNSKRRTIRRMMELCTSYQSLCTKCIEIKDKINFVKDNSRKNGISAQCNDCKNIYFKYKKDNDVVFKLSTSIRSMISTYIKSNGIKKTRRTEEIIGCSFIELKNHLEIKFIEDMSWENYGLWHIDHIIPISYAKSEIEIYKLNHYSNLQPLWAKDNLSKGNRFIG